MLAGVPAFPPTPCTRSCCSARLPSAAAAPQSVCKAAFRTTNTSSWLRARSSGKCLWWAQPQSSGVKSEAIQIHPRPPNLETRKPYMRQIKKPERKVPPNEFFLRLGERKGCFRRLITENLPGFCPEKWQALSIPLKKRRPFGVFTRDVDFKGNLRSYRTNQAKTIRKLD